MSDLITPPVLNAPVQPQTETVPKSELERIQNESKTQIESLRNELESVKLSDEYIAFKQDQITRKRQAVTPEPKKDDTKDPYVNRITSLEENIDGLQNTLGRVTAFLELSDARQRYPDFKDLETEIKEVLSKSPELSYEQAYLVSKGRKPAGIPVPEPVSKGSERPGGLSPLPDETERAFKSDAEASQAAVDAVLAKHGIKGDTL